jgi:hypothetical protein
MRVLMRGISIVVFVSLAAMGGSALAEPHSATLDILQGRALVDDGTGTHSGQNGQRVRFGDKITLLSGAAAIISNPETGCVLSLRQPGTYMVPDLAYCAAGHAQVMPAEFTIEPANGVYTEVFVPPPPPPPIALGGAAGVAPVMVGGAFVAATGSVFVLHKTIQSKKEPVSGY